MERKASEYYDNINMDLLNSIPADAKVVLEIGCGAGRLGAAHKARNAEVRYMGVEIDAPSAAIAAGRLDMVLCGSVEALDLNFLQNGVDCIVYGDVLEHLVDPWAVVKSHRALLRDGGRMVACIPNVQHWSVLLGLLHGQWRYHTDGLLDVTHLRFFTLSSIVAMFEAAGLSVENVIGRILDRERATSFVEKLRPALASLEIDQGRLQECASVFQYIVHAAPRQAG